MVQDSLQIFDAVVEPSVLQHASVGSRYQFEREGYYVVDEIKKSQKHNGDPMATFNLITGLRGARNSVAAL